MTATTSAQQGQTQPPANHSPLTAFVNFPSPYTQTLLVKALVSTLDSISISLLPPGEDDPPRLQWADYDLISFDRPHADSTNYLISSYIYRKALIRKHQLHLTITEYLAKCQHRGIDSVLARGGVPKGWVVDIQFADELDEALMDDLYELAEGMRENESKADGEKQWYILKPGFADRAQGIRIFSTEEQLRAIFESFEPPSSDEEDDDEEEDQDEEEEEDVNDAGGAVTAGSSLAEQMARLKAGNPDTDASDDEEEEGTGVMTSQLRHFVIQEYTPRPMLFDIDQEPHGPLTSTLGHKFHLRAYVLLSGSYQLYLARTLLSLFSSSPYDHPRTPRTPRTPSPSAPSQVDVDAALRPHLTNTCLQTDEFGAPIREEGLVKLFWELEGLNALRLPTHASDGDGDYDAQDEGRISKEWLEEVFGRVGEVVNEAVRAGVECGSFGLQLMPNAFEIFGVDLLLSFPPPTPTPTSTPTPSTTPSPTAVDASPPIPIVTLLEFNASPDFHQSGDRLQNELLAMFQGVVNGVVGPFFGLGVRSESGEEEEEDEEEEEERGEGEEAGKSDSNANDANETNDADEGNEMEESGKKRDEGQDGEWKVGQNKWGWRKIGQGAVRGPTV